MYKHVSRKSEAIKYAHLDQIALYRPDLEISHVLYNHDGLVNDIVIINDSIVFRFPKFDWAMEDMRQEAACLAIIEPEVALQVPSWTIYDDNCISYPIIPGRSLSRHIYELLDEDTKDKTAQDLGLFLDAIHSIPAKKVKDSGIKTSITYNTFEEWLSFYDEVQQELYPYMLSDSKDWIDYIYRKILANPGFMDFEPCLISGDLSSHHILFDAKTKSLSGIIDFGTSGLGDPATDFAYLLQQYGEDLLYRMKKWYPQLPVLLDRARFQAEMHYLQWALGGIRTNNPSWFLIHIGKNLGIGMLGDTI